MTDVAGHADSRKRITLLGMSIDVVTERQAVARIIESLSRQHGGAVITPNLDQLRKFYYDPSLRGLYERAELVVADGMPLVWASRIQKTPLPERVAGSSLIWSLTEAAAEAGKSVYLLGGNPGAADGAAATFAQRFPKLKIAGTQCPAVGFEKDPQQLARLRNELIAARPDVVYVGLGFPKQDRLIADLRDALPAAWFLGIGISFSFITGEVKRAPRWMQKTGLEWVHRMVQEPGRLFRRYILEDLPFAAILFWQSYRRRGRRN